MHSDKRHSSKMGRLLIAFAIVAALAALSLCYEAYCMDEVSDFVAAVREASVSEGRLPEGEEDHFASFRPYYRQNGTFLRVSGFDVIAVFLIGNNGLMYAKCTFLDQVSESAFNESPSWLTIPLRKENGTWLISGRVDGWA